jgi:tetratricopeptide (TPR) repeat protein
VTQQRPFKDLVQDIENSKRNGISCALLIGAGCSQSAGIPIASEIVEKNKDELLSTLVNLDTISYLEFMDKITTDQRKKLIAGYVNGATINWAHLAIAMLVKEGFVDRILTTNFDTLALQACALLGEFPAVYDLAMIEHFDPEEVHDKAILHLHGQYCGFNLKTTKGDLENHQSKYKKVFTEVGRKRLWIVVGYSGKCDQVFKELCQVEEFKNRLYWVCYENETPDEDFQKKLFTPEKCAHYIQDDFDADTFFIKLCQKLRKFPPTFINEPFSFLNDTLKKISSYPEKLSKEGICNPLFEAKEMIKKGINEIETPSELRKHADLKTYLMKEDYENAIKLADQILSRENIPEEARDLCAWAYITKGNLLHEKAKQTEDAEIAQKLLKDCFEVYGDAKKIKENMFETYINWGSALISIAEHLDKNNAIERLNQACNKLEKAIEINPNFQIAYYNLGIALSELAKRLDKGKTIPLFNQACKKYQEAIAINPNDNKSYTNWGLTLYNIAKRSNKEEAISLLKEACEKHKIAIKIKSDDHMAYNNLGSSLLEMANRSEKDAISNLEKATEKFQKVIKFKPDSHEAYYNLGTTLSVLAKQSDKEQAITLYTQSCEKYKKAIEIKSDKHEAYNNLGNTLTGLAKQSDKEQAILLFTQAIENYERAIEFKPDYHEAYDNWGITLSGLAQQSDKEQAVPLLTQACEKHKKAIELKPDDYSAYSNWGNTLLEFAELTTGTERDDILEECKKILGKGETIKPGSCSYNLACCHIRMNDLDKAKEFLYKSKEHGYLSDKSHLETDTDLDPVRNLPWFQELLEE